MVVQVFLGSTALRLPRHAENRHARPAESTDDIETCRGKTKNNRIRPLGYANHALFHYLEGKLTITSASVNHPHTAAPTDVNNA